MRSPFAPRAVALSLAWAFLSGCGAATDAGPGVQHEAVAAEDAPGFVVRFNPPHPLSRAQTLEAAGRCAEAAALARATLAASDELAGLCLERFTLGGSEIVLGACTPPPDVELFQRTWIERLRSMEAVAYADENTIAEAIECVG